MPDWHISFTVSGKKLDSALAVVHSLRPDNLGVRPVADHPKSGLTNGGGIRSKILMVLNGHPKGLRAKEITSLLVAAGNEVEEKSIGTTLAMMAKQKQVRRISKGLFGPRGK